MISDDAGQLGGLLAAVGIGVAVLTVLAGIAVTAAMWLGVAAHWLMPAVSFLGVNPADATAVGLVAFVLWFLPRLLAGVVALALSFMGGRVMTVLSYTALVVLVAGDRMGSYRLLDSMSAPVESIYDWVSLAAFLIVSGAVWLWFKWMDRSLGEMESRFAEEDLRDAGRPS